MSEFDPQPSSHVNLPASRIKKLMKDDKEVNMCSQDGVFCVAKATVGA